MSRHSSKEAAHKLRNMNPDNNELYRAHVLLVDDEEDFLKALSGRLTNRGLQVTSASSGEEALRIIAQKDFDIVVLDLAMPGMDGLETMKRIKRQQPKTETIMLTGHASLKSGIEAMKCGAGDYLEKPVDMKVLLKRIEDAQHKRIAALEKKSEEEVKRILKSMGW